MSSKIEPLKSRLMALKGERDSLQKQLAEAQQQKRKAARQVKVVELAGKMVREAALDTQRQLEYHIAGTVTAAEEAVFDDPYEFVANFEEKRGQPECVLAFTRQGQDYDPLQSSGFGPVDIAVFALRVVSLEMSTRLAPVMILDEPFKHLKGEEENRRAIDMVGEISRELGIQVIMVSDERAPREDIVEGADRAFEVKLREGRSLVKEIKGGD